MPRVLYCARTCPPLQPPYPLPPPKHNKPSAATPSPATQQHVDLDGPNSPTSPLPDPIDQEEYYDEYDEYRPPSPEPFSPDSEDYSYGDECFDQYLETVPDYANIALEHYNSQDKHEIKYQLVKGIVSRIIRYDGAHYHLNFTAKSTLEDSKEEFFFAELRLDFDRNAWVPVSIVALEENERVGGFSELIVNGGVDPRHCFGCGDAVKHPLDGSLYEGGHYLVENTFFHEYIEVFPATQLGDAQD
ncbi:unnamed protein product [Alopecurus aequalis]